MIAQLKSIQRTQSKVRAPLRSFVFSRCQFTTVTTFWGIKPFMYKDQAYGVLRKKECIESNWFKCSFELTLGWLCLDFSADGTR